MLPGGGLSLAVALVLLVLAAAKAHGRQVRLARERAGVTSVAFGQDNGPVVAEIWRHDRIRFWTSAVVVAVLLVALAAAGLFMPGWHVAIAIAVALVLAFAMGFIAAGLVAWGAQARPRAGDPQWLERANWGSLGWWTLVAAAAALVRFAM